VKPIVREARGSADIEAVLDLPARLHAHDPAWVAPLRVVVRRRTQKFLDEGNLVLFLAERDGRVVGTISALRDRDFERDKGERVVWFGYFESEDDPEIATALFDAAAARARDWGGTHLRGPRDLLRFENVGLTVEGHDTLPPFLQGHHPPYYQRLVERAGFAAHHDVLAYDIPVRGPGGVLRDVPSAFRRKAEGVDIPGLVVRSARRRSMGADLVLAHEVLNTAFETVPDVAPIPRAAFVSVGRTYLAIANPALLQIATVDGRPVGFAACFPELNEAIARAHGSLLPLGWVRVARGLRRVRTASFKMIGVLPEFRGTGLHAKLITHVVDGVRTAGYQRVEGSVIDERNGPMRAVVEGIGMTVYRRYRFYQRDVA
jgi:GNAT superfamily N-acetyltransferase